MEPFTHKVILVPETGAHRGIEQVDVCLSFDGQLHLNVKLEPIASLRGNTWTPGLRQLAFKQTGPDGQSIAHVSLQWIALDLSNSDLRRQVRRYGLDILWRSTKLLTIWKVSSRAPWRVTIQRGKRLFLPEPVDRVELW